MGLIHDSMVIDFDRNDKDILDNLIKEFGNEWINHSQQYFQMPIHKSGIHRLDYTVIKTALFNVGLNVSTIPSHQFQVFGREQEVPLYVFDNNDGFLNSGDFIEFYAEANDGWLDSLVYDSANHIPDKYLYRPPPTQIAYNRWITINPM